MLAKIDKGRGAVSITLADGTVHASSADPKALGELVLELLERPQPEPVTEPAGSSSSTRASSGPDNRQPIDFNPAGGSLEDLEAEAMRVVQQNAGQWARDGLGFLRSISRNGKAGG